MSQPVAESAAFSRSALFFWLFFIAAANALTGTMIRTVQDTGWSYAAFNLFGVSAIVWLGLVAGLALLRNDGLAEPPRRLDAAVAVFVAAVALVPVATASAVAMTFLAIYAIVTAERGSAPRRAAIIFLAITGSLIWGRLLLAVFSGPMLGADAFLVARLTGTTQIGNQLAFTDGSGAFAVAPGCSSFQGMSLALVFWATVNQWFAVPFGWKQMLWCLAALGATIAVNVVRIGALAHFPRHFDALHNGIGYQVAAWTTLILVVAICLYGAHREAFARS
jgi:exosortase/archaeosortase family protein